MLVLIFTSSMISFAVTGTAIVGENDINLIIPNTEPNVKYTFPTITGVPEDAVVTNVAISIRVANDLHPEVFKCSDYELWLGNAQHGTTGKYVKFWDNYGGTTDEGVDDDAADDADITLNLRSFLDIIFDGDNVNQAWYVYLDDNVEGNIGVLYSCWLLITWEAPDPVPNLTKVTPTLWENYIVISSTYGTYSNASTYIASNLHYIDFAIACRNTDITESFSNSLIIDGEYIYTWTYSELEENDYTIIEDWPRMFTVGEHEICSEADRYGDIDETDEDDNISCVTINVIDVPEPPELSSPSNNSECQSTSLTLSWSSSEYAGGYYLQVDDNNDFSSLVMHMPVEGTSQAISDLVNGKLYYWRVRATNAAGNSEFSSVYHFTTKPAAPAAPTLSLPADEASCQPLEVTLDWNGVVGIESYDIQFDSHTDFSSPSTNTLMDTDYDVSELANSATYYWRVRSREACSVVGSWTDAFEFTTKPLAPSPPGLDGPADRIDCQPIDLTLDWNPVTNASAYSLQVDDNEDFNSPEFEDATSATESDASGLDYITKYYWRVKAENSCGDEGHWSDVRWFETTTNGLDMPALSEPEANSTDQDTALFLTWLNVEHSVSFNLQLDDDDDFSSSIIDESDIDNLTMDVSGLEKGETYYWRVSANGACEVGEWCDSYQFITKSADDPDDPDDSDNPDTSTAITDVTTNGYHLGQNYPNPFSESTKIDFSIPEVGEVIIEIDDLQGKVIKMVKNVYPAGKNTAIIEFENRLPTGVYIYHMKTAGYINSGICVVN